MPFLKLLSNRVLMVRQVSSSKCIGLILIELFCFTVIAAPDGAPAYKLNEALLKQRSPFLATFIQGLENSEQIETDSMFELQDLMEEHSHPRRKLILCDMCDMNYMMSSYPCLRNTLIESYGLQLTHC